MKHTLTLLLGLALAASVNSLNAQNTVVTYQGRVTDNGTNFNGTGQFKFALLTSTNNNHTATALAGVSGGLVQVILPVLIGNGYVTPPTVTISGGGGSGAAATATLSSGAVIFYTIDNPGSGYSTPPTVTISAPPEDIAMTTYWSNDGTTSAVGEPTAAVNASVANGLFTVGLGDTSLANMTELSAALFQQTNLQLRIWFNDGANGFAALSPLQNLTAAPYANYAYAATTLSTGSNQPLNLTINGTNLLHIALVYDPDASSFTANSVGGYSGNVISNGVKGGFIGGGGYSGGPNRVGANYASVLGGAGNTASGFAATAMGLQTTASGFYSTAMGYATAANGFQSTAMGTQAKALHGGTFVWGDSTFADIASTNPDSVTMRAAGGYRLFSNSGATSGVFMLPNANAWSAISDRNAKKNFQPVDSREVLEKLAHVPVERWNYKSEPDDSVPHIGPMAQDFKAAFYPGRDDKSISTLEFDGVALAAIQGLNEKVEVRSQKSEDRMQKLETENADLKKELADLKGLVVKLGQPRKEY